MEIEYGQAERLISAFERIGVSLDRMANVGQKFYDKLYPEPRKPSDAIVTRVPTREDKIKERQGSSIEPLRDWLSDVVDAVDEPIGVYERAFLEAQKKSSSKDQPREARPDSGSAEEIRSDQGRASDSTANNSTTEAR